MKRLFYLFLMGTLGSSCIRMDEVRTFFLNPDGTVDMVMFQDNVVSDAQDVSERTKEQKKWLSEFKAKKNSDFSALEKAKAKDVRSSILRQVVPFSVVTRAHFATSQAFGDFLLAHTEEGKTSYSLKSDGDKRTLEVKIEEKKPRTDAAKKQNESSAAGLFPIWKFVPVNGKVNNAVGCRIIDDGRSCVLDFDELTRQERDQGRITFELTWTIASAPQKKK